MTPGIVTEQRVLFDDSNIAEVILNNDTILAIATDGSGLNAVIITAADHNGKAIKQLDDPSEAWSLALATDSHYPIPANQFAGCRSVAFTALGEGDHEDKPLLIHTKEI